MNHAYLYGRSPLTLKTLNYNYGLDGTRYVAFNFYAIEAIIDIIGFEIEMTNNHIDSLNNLHSDDKDDSYLTKSGVQ